MSTKTRRDHRSDHSSNTETREEHAEKPAPAKQKVSEEERTRLVKVCAYSLWEQAGKPDGTRPGSGVGARPRTRSRRLTRGINEEDENQL